MNIKKKINEEGYRLDQQLEAMRSHLEPKQVGQFLVWLETVSQFH